jgi:hypothetical protein
VIAKIDPRKDPYLSLQAWTAQAKGDQSLAVKIQKTVQKKVEDRSLEESKLLETHFIHYHYRGIPQKALAFRKKIQAQKTEIAQKTAEVEKFKKEIENHRKTIRSMLVSESGNSATVRILPRGNWLDETGEVVHPAIPEFLGKLQTGERQANRMDLAKWLPPRTTPFPPALLSIAYGNYSLAMGYPDGWRTWAVRENHPRMPISLITWRLISVPTNGTSRN